MVFSFSDLFAQRSFSTNKVDVTIVLKNVPIIQPIDNQ